ncbi:MAG: TldD/PmbA family protein, partial [Rhodobacteraceae bacterium]|nr:TldD/PmbA family protein [Paracoccaceae bacterium]
MTATDRLADLTHALLDAARAAGAEAADAMALDGTSLSVGVRSGALEDAERSEATDLGLRVLIDGRQACVSASDTSRDTLRNMAEHAVAMAREAPRDPHIGLADPEDLCREWDLAALDLNDPAAEPAAEALRDLALRCEAAALDRPGISQVSSTHASFGRRHVHLAASNGFSGGYARSSTGLSCSAITGTGGSMERDHFGDMRTHAADMLSPEEIGRIAADRTLARAGARQPATGSFPVLFDERISGSLIAHLLGAINGTAITRGASWLRDALGQQVLPAGIDLIEDPTRPRVTGSRPFDAEGLPARPRRIIENGILTGWTLDLATGRKLGLPSTGNAVRGPSSPPSPSVSNATLTPGRHSAADLMAQMGTGLLVTGLIGSTINPTTGDYSRGASGLWIENGAPAYPVNECTIAGNLRDMLARIIPANDARPHLSRVVPSLLIEGM